ncbi:MAG: hypothetical protein GEU75_14625, partial [Dehalococcoidia bacterium]|nr:hypothetical protein [Dehalococcoidia bacterium]
MKLRAIFSLLAALVIATVLTGIFSSPKPAAAHPLGNFTINALARLELLAGGEVRLRYIVDMAEIPAFQELRAIDRDGDGAVSDAEAASYLDRIAPELVRNLDLHIGSERVTLTSSARGLSFPEGQGGLDTLRLTLDLTGALPEGWQSGAAANLSDGNYDGRIGWRQIVVLGGEGIVITETTALTADETAGLTLYPSSRLQSPPDMRQARFRLEAGVSRCSEMRLTP